MANFQYPAELQNALMEIFQLNYDLMALGGVAKIDGNSIVILDEPGFVKTQQVKARALSSEIIKKLKEFRVLSLKYSKELKSSTKSENNNVDGA
jgi:hypothetical protein